MKDLAERPIFIVGAPRSGTTLMRFILSSHPRIYIPEETGFLPFLQFDPGEDLDEGQVQDLLDRIGILNRNWAGVVPDLHSFYDQLPEPTLAFVLDALYRRYIEQFGAVRWGDKTPTYVRHLPFLAGLFPNAQFVHIIRDGRDATLSALRKWGAKNRYMDSYYLLRNWSDSVRIGQEDGKALGLQRYLTINYEELVREPQKVIQSICAFLGEEFDVAMLDHTRLARQKITPGGHVEVRQPITTASVGRWKPEMSLYDLKLTNKLAGPMLQASGYELANVPGFTPFEGVKFRYQAIKYFLVSTVRRLLYSAGFLTLNRGKRRSGLRRITG